MFLRAWFIAVGLAISGLAHAFVPETGTWVFHDEENGKPGRGLTLDVQNDTLVVTYYGYEQNGHPTFYIGAGKLSLPSTEGPSYVREVTATVDLARYSGGRFVGGEARDAVASGGIGKTEFKFIHGTLGVIALPGESPKRISRFAFGAPKRSAEQMLGAWIFSTEKYSADLRTSQEAEFFFFNSVTEELDSSGEKIRYAVSFDGRMKCREAPAGFVFTGTGNEIRNFTSIKECTLTDAQNKILKKYNFNIGANNNGKGEIRFYSSTGSSSYTVDLHVFRIFDSAGRSLNVGSPSNQYFGF